MATGPEGELQKSKQLHTYTHLASTTSMENINNGLVMQEMIRVAMQRLGEKKSGTVTKKEILKVLYYTRSKLPDSNPYKRVLAYYWYLDGPYCEPIYNDLEKMVASDLVRRNKGRGYENYKLDSRRALQPLVQNDVHMDMVRAAIRNVVDKFVNIVVMVDDIYGEAPYKWYRTYKLDLLPKFENHCQATEDGRRSLHTDGQMTELLEAAVRDYPEDAMFATHRRVFTDFAKLAKVQLGAGLPRFAHKTLGTTRSLCVKVWDAFAYGVRIAHHDEYYNYRVDGWRREYLKKTSELVELISNYTNEVVSVSNREVVIDLIKQFGMGQAADRLVYLDSLSREDPDEGHIGLESLRHLAIFMLERRLPVPNIGVAPGGVAHAVWWPQDGILSADFMPDGMVEFAAVLPGQNGEWSADGVIAPDGMMERITPVVEALRA